LWKAPVRTDACKRISALISDGENDTMFFGSSTTQHSEKYIKQQFRELVKHNCTIKGKEKPEEMT
jgi:hypothetical protein